MLYTDNFDEVTLKISTDGGASWSLVDTYIGPLTHSSLQNASYDISPYIDNDTRIKFETENFGDNDQFFLDNVVIDFNTNVITVDTANDVSDGGDGLTSLREAIEAANTTPGLDKINFNIPGSGPHTITLDPLLGALPGIVDTVIIDGTSEPDFSNAPVIEIDGSALSAAPGDYDAFLLDAGSDGSTIRGLSITGFTDGNGHGYGFDIRSDNNVIAGNYIGLAPDGVSVDGNRLGVVLLFGAEDNIIGGADEADKNLISGSSYAGVTILHSTTARNVIVGNDIGLDANGDTVTSGTFGVLVYDGAHDNIIGGVNPGEGNSITGHREGVVIDDNFSPALNNAILANQIYDNREMAIDLGNDGITDNDVDDVDSGPNDELNYPVLNNVSQNGSDLEVSFNLEVPAAV